jgi:hypothetical protein
VDVANNAGQAADATWADATISMIVANLVAFAMFPVVAVVLLGPYALTWGGDALWESLETAFRLPWFIPIFFLLIIVHEGLHAVGFARFGRVARRDITFGVKWLTLTPYAHTGVPMPASAYRVAVLLPAVALGLVPAAIGLLAGNGILAAWGTLMLGAAGGDLAILWAIRSVPNSATIRDHPSKAGCLVRVD